MTLICIGVADRANLEAGILLIEDLLAFSSKGMFNFNPSLIGCCDTKEWAPNKISACVWPEYDITLTVHLIT